MSGEFQFTHPGRGATTSNSPFWSGDKSFNSRTPGGVRPLPIAPRLPPRAVSIHAPREGCDSLEFSVMRFLLMFQFTHPGRGATVHTALGLSGLPCFNSRTPGGVRLYAMTGYLVAQGFNSRTPGGVRRRPSTYPRGRARSFNSRTPGGVRRKAATSSTSARASFNSRTPGGVRPSPGAPLSARREFQFTHPGRGATNEATTQ